MGPVWWRDRLSKAIAGLQISMHVGVAYKMTVADNRLERLTEKDGP